MNHKLARSGLWAAGIVLGVLLLLSLLWVRPVAPTVQAAVITPVASVNGRGAESAIYYQWFGGNITADTRICKDTMGAEALDYQWSLAASAANTTSLTIQNSIISGQYNAAQAVATSVSATPAVGMAQAAAFGRQTCVLVDVTNATPVAVKFEGVVK